MSGKRRDHRGRILKTGESQRSDLLYQYRYTDIFGKRKTIYDKDLNALREKEREIQKSIEDGLLYSSKKTSVVELVERYLDTKRNIRVTTMKSYTVFLNALKKDPFSKIAAAKVKKIDAKNWVVRLYDSGRPRSYIIALLNLVKPAFDLACDDGIISKNPFDFRLNFIPDTSIKRAALTPEQLADYLDFVWHHSIYRYYYDIFVILSETGIRAGELCGLTESDVDLEKRTLTIDHQLYPRMSGAYHIGPPKSKSGYRTIPLTDAAVNSFRRALESRPEASDVEIVDGRTGFIFRKKNGGLFDDSDLGYIFRRLYASYIEYRDTNIPNVTPHVLRHTFCTTLINKGVNPKLVQYLMGHSDVTLTLNTYSHMTKEYAIQEFSGMQQVQSFTTPQKQISVVSTTPFSTPIQ